MKKKRISFDKYDAIHIYEWLRFYWDGYFKKYPKDRKIMNKFGNCPQCTIIGERLEKFIGKKEIEQVKGYLKDINNKTKL